MSKNSFSLPLLDIRSLPGPETILRRELPNGITVLARENFSSPAVIVTGYIWAGAMNEPRTKAGLAQLTAQALMWGTEKRDSQDIFESIESIGARLGFGAGTHTTTFQGKALVEDLGLILDLVSDVLQNPLFPKTPVDRLKAQQLTGIAIRDQDTGAQAQLAFDDLVYVDHPYSIPASGYRETVSDLEPADLRKFHSHHFGPKGMVIAIVGALEAEDALGAIENSLAAWSNPNMRERVELPAVNRLTETLRRNVFLEGKTQCDLVVGVPGPSRFEEHYLAASLGNNILGRFGLFGRIGDVVREAAGLAYYAYSSLSGGPGPGPWQVSAGVNPVNVEKAITLILSEIRRFITERVTNEELLENQANYIGRLPLQLESNEGVAGALIHMERYGLGLDYFQKFPDLIKAITREQILDAAQLYLDAERIAIGVAGPIVEGG
jgi:zinc protease